MLKDTDQDTETFVLQIRVTHKVYNRCKVWADRIGIKESDFIRAALILGSYKIAEMLRIRKDED